MKGAFFVFAGFALLVWALAQEQRAASYCMNGGHVWRQSSFPELVGTCLPAPPPRRILLPPLQIEQLPDVGLPEQTQVPAL